MTPERPPDGFPGSPYLAAGRWRREDAPGPLELYVTGEGIEVSLAGA